MFAYEFGVLSAGSGLNIMGISQLAGIPVTSDPKCPVPAAQVCVSLCVSRIAVCS